MTSRVLRVAGAQMGPTQRADRRERTLARLIALLEQAVARGARLVVFPELAFTTFFPRWHHEDRREADTWFEREMPNEATRPLFERAAAHGVALSFGYADTCADDRDGRVRLPAPAGTRGLRHAPHRGIHGAIAGGDRGFGLRLACRHHIRRHLRLALGRRRRGREPEEGA